MSTLSANLNSAASAISTDFFGRLFAHGVSVARRTMPWGREPCSEAPRVGAEFGIIYGT